MNILVTGCAGFIGFHLCKTLNENKKNKVYGIDNLNNYYDVKLKNKRLDILKKSKNFCFYKIDIKNIIKLEKNFNANKYDIVINLAAQAGVRHSINNPKTYLDSNIIGFFNVLEVCRNNNIKHLIFASTSSVYGDSKKFPLKEEYNTDRPMSFYAATKKSNEVMAYSYSYIHKLKITGLRFFTVFGPFGRPDMALFKFTKAIFENKKIHLYNNGNHIRDFTYIDDLISMIIKIINKPPNKKIPFEIFNMANSQPTKLLKFISEINKYLNKRIKFKKMPMQLGDVKKTHAHTAKINNVIKKDKKTKLNIAIYNFIEWYKDYHKIK
tara:strand:- start:2977 stop:3948 length:972 start_codon:yes stop_codon:yes gene_type:complete